jgi:hypothetical protein
VRFVTENREPRTENRHIFGTRIVLIIALPLAA